MAFLRTAISTKEPVESGQTGKDVETSPGLICHEDFAKRLRGAQIVEPTRRGTLLGEHGSARGVPRLGFRHIFVTAAVGAGSVTKM